MIRAFTADNWNFIAVVHPNLVTFLKEKETGIWKRRQHELVPDYNSVEDAIGLYGPESKWTRWDNLASGDKVADSLFNINAVLESISRNEDWIEFQESDAKQLWEECKKFLGLSDKIVPTAITY